SWSLRVSLRKRLDTSLASPRRCGSAGTCGLVAGDAHARLPGDAGPIETVDNVAVDGVVVPSNRSSAALKKHDPGRRALGSGPLTTVGLASTVRGVCCTRSNSAMAGVTEFSRSQ